MQKETLAPPLATFVNKVEQLVEGQAVETDMLPLLGEAMKDLVREDNWLDSSVAQPHPEYYQQYLLYADPDDRFSVVSFVWGPGQSTPIHDHTVWGVIGMLRGAEYAENYNISEDGTPVATGEAKLNPGDVEFVSPTIGDVHKVSNAFDDQVSISIHAYGSNIGKVKRHVFPEQGGPAKDFISGYSDPVE